MVPREQSEVREKILDAALHAFSEKGYNGATVRQIAEQSSTNQALISYYFGGKEQLFFELVDQAFPRFSVWSDHEDPVQVIRDIIGTMIRFKMEHSCLAKMIHQEVSMSSCRREALANYIEPLATRVKNALTCGVKQEIFQIGQLEVVLSCVMSVILIPEELAVCPEAKMSKNGCVDSVIASTVKFVLNGLGYQVATGVVVIDID